MMRKSIGGGGGVIKCHYLGKRRNINYKLQVSETTRTLCHTGNSDSQTVKNIIVARKTFSRASTMTDVEICEHV